MGSEMCIRDRLHYTTTTTTTTAYDIRHTTYDIRHTTYDILHTAYYILHTTYFILHTTYLRAAHYLLLRPAAFHDFTFPFGGLGISSSSVWGFIMVLGFSVLRFRLRNRSAHTRETRARTGSSLFYFRVGRCSLLV